MFIWNVSPDVCIASTAGTGRLAFGFPTTAGV